VRADQLEEKVLSILKKKLSSVNVDALIDEHLKGQEERYASQKKMVEARRRDLNELQKGIDNLMKALTAGVAIDEIKEHLGTLKAKKEVLTAEIKEIEKSSELDQALEREALKYFIGDLGTLIEKAEKNSAALKEMLKEFIRVDFDTETRHGALTVFLPQEHEKAIPFSISKENAFSLSVGVGRLATRKPLGDGESFWVWKKLHEVLGKGHTCTPHQSTLCTGDLRMQAEALATGKYSRSFSLSAKTAATTSPQYCKSNRGTRARHGILSRTMEYFPDYLE